MLRAWWKSSSVRTSCLLSRATFLLSRYFFFHFSPTAIGHLIPCPVVQGSRYSTPDSRLTIFACDLFDINSELVGDVDAVWDRGSFVALSFEARPRYVALLKSLVGKSFRWVIVRLDWIDLWTLRYLLQAWEYDKTLYPGPPHRLKHSCN